MKSTIGIVGHGFIGKAVSKVFSQFYNIAVYDKYLTEFIPEVISYPNIENLCKQSKYIFVAVPTPMNESGSCNILIVDSVVEEINKFSDGHIVIIKSTIPPGTTNKFNEKYKNVKIVFSPEFLTENNAEQDFRNSNRIIIGGPREAATKIKTLHQKVFKEIPIIKTDATYAEMVKYTTNCYLATKVLFANEMYQICKKLEIDYDKVVEYASYDERLGRSHLNVPGHDGKLGVGGSCLPKDLNALIIVGKELGVDMTILNAVWSKNLSVRPEKDWEYLVGRAVSKKE